MKLIRLLIPSLALALAGCAGTTRVVTDTLAAAVGGATGNALSKGNPLITAAGAAGGVLVGEIVNHAAERGGERARNEGYEQGRSDAVKQQYWVLVNQQRAEAGEGETENVSLFEIPVPERTVDGAILKPTTRVLRIEE